MEDKNYVLNKHHQVKPTTKSNFDVFLSTIPKLDPIDRTVEWVLSQPDMSVSY